MKILLIGYGNPLCGDDGIGPYAVEQLSCHEPTSDDVQYMALRQLTPELAEAISKTDTVIFIDAANGIDTQTVPGQITCQRYGDASPLAEPVSSPFTHHVHPRLLLDAAYTLYNHMPAAYLFTVAGENFGLGDSFSAVVDSALPLLLSAVQARIEQCTNMA